mmetsp:Transcript_111095/g.248065  ORF Transcript_111095/g.248065 Transcript_111095/m.248065 type:complete len:217 (+) Transcript_111095:240-890(+)
MIATCPGMGTRLSRSEALQGVSTKKPPKQVARQSGDRSEALLPVRVRCRLRRIVAYLHRSLWKAPQEEDEEDNAHAPEVAGFTRPALLCLGGDVGGGAHDIGAAVAARLIPAEHRQSEIDDLNLRSLRLGTRCRPQDHDILGLEVAMDHGAPVAILEDTEDLLHDVSGATLVEDHAVSNVLLDLIKELAAIDILKHQINRLAVLVRLHQSAYAWMI